ncbi:MAG: methylated-DNA--[protein]-cysteine S-methyltransferase, partial [Firmicutes bacterium]|nr:methylated-DNA--[protein]-cysteine S-methyltransferase [Bacillota bacterium]
MKNSVTFDTKVGPITIEEEAGAISAVEFDKRPQGKKTPLIAKAYQQIAEYLDGKRTTFDLPLKIVGTSFQKEAWKVLLGIPYGTTISYKEEAEKSGHPKAYRAIGSANGANRICIVIPCHRVINHDGRLGGFANDPKIK